MAIKNVILHVGMHKTGTSSIQASLHFPKNTPLLSEKGLYYPAEFGINHGVDFFNMFCTDPQRYLMNAVMGMDEKAVLAKRAENLATLRALIQGRPEETMVISGEDISLLKPEELKALKRAFLEAGGIESFRIIAYVRSPVDYYVSLKQTMVVIGDVSGKFSNNFAGNRYDAFHFYELSLAKFYSVFGAEAVELHTFEEALEAWHDPVKHFLSLLGYTKAEADRFSSVKDNESQCQEVIDFLFFFNQRVPVAFWTAEGKFPNPERSLYDYTPLMSVKGLKYNFSLAERKQLAGLLKEDTQWLKEYSGVDYLPDLQATLDAQAQPAMTSGPETYDALFDAFIHLYSQRDQLLFMEYLAANQGLSPHMPALRERCAAYLSLPKFLEGASAPRSHFFLTDTMPLLVYEDRGSGFCDEHAQLHKLPEGFASVSMVFDPAHEIKRLRIDPHNFACFVYLKAVDCNVPWTITGGNWTYREQNLFLFLEDDPQFHLETAGPIERLDMELLIDPIKQPFAWLSARDFLGVLREKHFLNSAEREALDIARHQLAVTEQLLTGKNHAFDVLTAQMRGKEYELSVSQRESESLRAQMDQAAQAALQRQGALEGELSALRQHSTALEGALSALREYNASLEGELSALRGYNAALEGELSVAQQHGAALSAALEGMEQSTSWRVTRPLRAIGRRTKA